MNHLLIWWHTYVHTIKLHIDINTSNVNIIMSHVDIIYIYLVWWAEVPHSTFQTYRIVDIIISHVDIVM